MKALLAKIRKILRDRRTRGMLSRIISVFAAFVVFVTTYALVLPAITLESQASCGLTMHQHDDSCYELQLTCGLPESEGHVHRDTCYSIENVLICEIEEHRHSVDEGCYDEAGNLICKSAAHEHGEDCFEEVRELVCGLNESEGHRHGDSCYEKILACGLEPHTHSAECYRSDAGASGSAVAAGTGSAAVASTAYAVVASAESAAEASTSSAAAASTGSAAANRGSTAAANTGSAAAAGAESAAGGAEKAVGAGDAGEAASTAVADSFGYVPALEPLDFPALLNGNTGIYYSRPVFAEDERTAPDKEAADPAGSESAGNGADRAPADWTDWSRIDRSTELGKDDLLRVYLAYTIPAGSLNSTNPTARYRLPANLRLTDEQVDAINMATNGISSQYVNLDTLEILDADAYQAALGAEAVEGTRTPDEPVEDYLKKLERAGREAAEFISATVKVENEYDENTGELLAQDLVFTFTPYTVMKNQHEYDADGQPTKAGEEVAGWVSFDISTDAVDWIATGRGENDENTEENRAKGEDGENAEDGGNETQTAEVVFVEKDKELGLEEISTEMKLVFHTDAGEAVSHDVDTETVITDTTDPAVDDMADGTEYETENGTKERTEGGEETDKQSVMNYPAVTFDDSITVTSGTLTTDMDDAESVGKQRTDDHTEITVHVEADADTFPEGTTMVLSAVDDNQMPAVAEAVEGALSDKTDGESRTQGFHAVDISFRNGNGTEIEPLKPIRVSMTSDAIKRAVENSSTAPVVVHVTEKVSETVDGTVEEATGADIDTLTFESDSFSVYAIVYTVDFAYEVDGKVYSYSIPGGGFTSLAELVRVLGIVSDNPDTEQNEVAAFISNVKSVEFSSSELISVIKIEEDTTVGAVKQEYGLDCEYSRNLTNEQIDSLNNTEIKAVDWLIISLKAFTSTESLTVTMNSGEKFTINMTDAQESTYVFNWRPSSSDAVQIVLHYVDGSGKPLSVESGSETIQSGQRVYLTEPTYSKQIEGYNLYSIKVNGEEVNNFSTVKEQGLNDTKVYFNRLYYGWNDYVTEVETYEQNPVDIYLTYLKEGELDPNVSGGGTLPLPVPSAELPTPQASKTLTPNLKDPDDPASGDGTYTLTLSMEVPKIGASTSNHKNVIIVFDTSNSMSEPVNTDGYHEDSEHGAFVKVDNKYYKVSTITIGKKTYYVYTDEYGKNTNINGTPTFYSPNISRLTIAREKVKELAGNLLNSGEDIELSFVQFDSTVENEPAITTNLTEFQGWVDNAWPSAQKDHDFHADMGATNWDAALRAANSVSFGEGDQDQTYIIFISDGNPTARTTEEGDDGDRIGSSLLGDHFYNNVYGTGHSDTKGYNFNCAEAIASKAISEDGKIIFNVGLFGDAGEMAALSNHGYYDAVGSNSIEQAFRDIVKKMSVEMGYTELSIFDGITTMTSSTLVKDPEDFTYQVTKKNASGEDEVVEGVNLTAPVYHSGDNANTANIESGYVTWNLGNKRLLEGGTYSVSFIVWPDQDAYDLVADLNNKIKDYIDLTDDQKSQIIGSGTDGKEAPFSLKTNTAQTVTYKPGTIMTNGDTVTPVEGDPLSANLATPSPMPLTDTTVKVQKKWDVSLAPGELQDFLAANPEYKVRLKLMKDTGKEGTDAAGYISDISIDPVSGAYIWPEMKDNREAEHHISTGLMVSTEAAGKSGLNVDGYPTREYNGVTYHILEEGRDYYFEEDYPEDEGTDYHFEFEKKLFHPMVVDGEMRNVTFEGDAVKDIENLTTLTAVNSLRGGINIEKKIVDQDGQEIVSTDKTTEFKLHGSITRKVETAENEEPGDGDGEETGESEEPGNENAEGKADNEEAGNGDGEEKEETRVGTRIEYRLLGEEYTDEFGNAGQSTKRVIADSSDFILPIHAGDTLRLINVPSGYEYKFYEELSGDTNVYSFYSIEGTTTRKTEDGKEVPYPEPNMEVGQDGTLSGISLSNAAQTITVKNQYDQDAPPPNPLEPKATVIASKQIDYLGDSGADSDDLNKGGTDAHRTSANAGDRNDLYRLYLDATMKKYISGANIMIVEDYSTSMNGNGGYTGMQKALVGEHKDGLIYDLLREDNNNQLMIIKFSDTNEHPLTNGTSINGSGVIVHWTTNAKEAADVVSQPFPTTATVAWEQGDYSFWTDYTRALQLIDENIPNNGKPTYVIFMSDGVPTVYLEKNGQQAYDEVGAWEKRTGFPDYAKRWAVDGKAIPENLNVVIPATESTIKAFVKDHQNLNIVTVGYGEAAEGKKVKDVVSGTSLINESLKVGEYDTNKLLKDLGRTGYYSAADANELQEVLTKALTLKPITALEIRDTLSDYVEYYAKDPDLSVTKTTGNGDVTKLTVREDNTVYDGSVYVGKIVRDGKKISLLFDPKLKYKDSDKYTLAFNVEASSKAYAAYAQNKGNGDQAGYGNNVGDLNTDYRSNNTSVGQDGFPSNADAAVTYKYGEEEKTEIYPKPVIQVGDTKLELEKKWVDKTGKAVTPPVDHIRIRLYADVPNEDGNGSTRKTVGEYTIREGSDDWKLEIPHLNPKVLVHPGEENALYQPIRYVAEELNPEEGYAVEVTFDRTETAGGSSFSNITNRYEAVGKHIYYIKEGEQEKTGHGIITNRYEPVDLVVKKNWNIDDADTNEALKDSKVRVTLGRLILTDKAGILTITKTGVPAGMDFEAAYIIAGDNGKTYGPFSYEEVAGGLPVSVAPGTYTVTETVQHEDDTVDWNHSSHQVTGIEIADEGTGSAAFSCSPNVKTGKLQITSTVDKGGSNIDFSGVTYTVYAGSEGNLSPALYADGSAVPVMTFSDLGTGKVLDHLKIGTYTVVEGTLPEADGYMIADHTPANCSFITVDVTDSEEPAKADFSTRYEEDNVYYTLTVMSDCQIQYQIPDPKTYSYKKGTEVTITFDYNDGSKTWMNGQYGNVSVKVDGVDKGLIFNQKGNRKELTVRIMGDTRVVLTNTGNSNWNNITQIMSLNPEEQKPDQSSASQSPKLRRTTRMLLGIKAGDAAPAPDHYGETPVPADTGKKYVEDVSFKNPADSSKPYAVEITQADRWEKVVRGLPLTDGQGRLYYYYIKEVTEENMPSGTSCTVKLDGEDKYLVGSDLHAGEALEVTNTLTEPEPLKTSIKIFKVIRGASAPYTPLGGAGFTLTRVDENGHEPAAESDRYTTGEVMVGANGELEFTELLPGRYLLEETTIPGGYITKEGPYYVVIDADGGSDIEDDHGYTLIHELQENEYTVENEPGVELPSAGGSGTIAIYLTGLISVFLASAGLARSRSRRRRRL